MAQFHGHPPPPPPNSVWVIDPHYCAYYPVHLAIVRKVMNITDGNFVVKDINNNGIILFNLKGFLATFHKRRVLFDAAGTPLVTLRKKGRSYEGTNLRTSAHDRWQVFRGESNDLIFTTKKPEMLQFNKNLDVFLARNTEERVCDFKVKGSWSEKSCVVYLGESDTIVAEMHKKSTVQSFDFGKDEFQVTVSAYNSIGLYGYIPRSANNAADGLAKNGIVSSEDLFWLEEFPLCVSRVVMPGHSPSFC
ncbi:hypothetical protein EZV62_016862 [Acer yangbiense]|uniref:Uncharacterized protein n=1 Tax=Acer yangbiense TaxID=1000413 RepID=A0A5C7HPP1_9ROSI|nr:hypothetical protein EZV62_016862 [Acer yangbiense]